MDTTRARMRGLSVRLIMSNQATPASATQSIQRAIIQGVLHTDRLRKSDAETLAKTVAEIEKRMIIDALALANGVKARAAALLKLNRTTLVEKMRRLGMEK